MKVSIPASVPQTAEKKYQEHYTAITRGTGNLFMFAADQKLEHLHADFWGDTIAPEVANPRHLFTIAQDGDVGVFATHLGLISRYGRDYADVNYLVKLNGKSNIVPTEHKDPFSGALWTVDDVATFQKNSGLNIRGVGYTIYLGSHYEAEMLEQAAQIVFQAHQYGLIAALWVYPRGAAVAAERSGDMVVGAAGVAHSLGADFVKINQPEPSTAHSTQELLHEAVRAAGNTKVVCSGGARLETPEQFIDSVKLQMASGAAGTAVGRNIFQYPYDQALVIAKGLSSLIYCSR